ncbi:CGNR zinc finger domain-containing protein [Clostridium sp. DMHC 10]|uniref:CGNR zinc finger domain-containing protein n=1 Tax=Clostridium sp. DMHC 10 TaxID=747377 RepID=UPI00069CFAA3|nr:CGNR zinc finger domain-containing protein [Clostridium sp. DMHC 10]
MIDTLLELRNFLSDLIEGISSQNTIGSEDINKINKYLMPFLFYRTLKSDGKKYYIEDAIYGKSNNFIVFEVVSSFIEMISKYDIKRMKLCQNPECKWAFYDESKNCTRKWCDNTCATLMKVRKFRQNKSKINKDKTQ